MPIPARRWIAVAVAIAAGACNSRRSTEAAAPAAASVAPVIQTFADGEPGWAFVDPARRSKLAAAFPAIDAAVEDERTSQGVQGLAIGIVIDGELAHAQGFGVRDLANQAKPDADTVYRIGSITKTFTALAILGLRDRGTLSLDDPLARWIPEASRLVYGSHDVPPITLRSMLSHASGLPWQGTYDVTKAPSEQTITASLAGLPLENAPGAVVYSNLGFVLLGIVAGRARQASYHDVISELVLRPLGMTSTFWDRDAVPAGRLATSYDFDRAAPKPRDPYRIGAADPSGGMYSSVRDLARYVAFQLAAYPPRHGAETGPIRRATVRESHTFGVRDRSSLQFATAPARGERVASYIGESWAAGWGVVQTCDFDDLISKGGAIDSYRADVELVPSRGVGVIVLSNFIGSSNNADVRRVSGRIFDQLLRTGALARRVRKPAPAFAAAMSKLLAVYHQWDDAGYKAMLDPRRPAIPAERDELAGYHQLHGKCTAFSPVEVTAPLQARFAMQCERGSFELAVALSADSGLITGFTGTSRDVAPPPELRAAATAIASLVGTWRGDTYTRYLARTTAPRDQPERELANLRDAHGSCTAASFVHEGIDWRAELACERGGGLVLELAVRPDGTVASYRFRAPPGCPTR
jgi:CubicO group peptidase (beta-lactamase class C family)